MKDFNMRAYIDIVNEEQQLNEFKWCGGPKHMNDPECRPSMGAMHDTQKMMHQNWEMELDDDAWDKLQQEKDNDRRSMRRRRGHLDQDDMGFQGDFGWTDDTDLRDIPTLADYLENNKDEMRKYMNYVGDKSYFKDSDIELK
jgi:hypothetical protein